VSRVKMKQLLTLLIHIRAKKCAKWACRWSLQGIYVWKRRLMSWKHNLRTDSFLRSSTRKDVPTFYGTRRSIIVFTTARHWTISWAKSIQSIPFHPISVRFILILSSHLPLVPALIFVSHRWTSCQQNRCCNSSACLGTKSLNLQRNLKLLKV
jgi:hypothetical protein